MTIRRAAAADAALLAGLHATAFDRPWSAMEIHQLLSSGASGAVIEDAGFILWRTAGDEAEILTLAVDPARRRAGLGGALVEAALSGARGEGAASMFLEVAEDNAAAIALYAATGFEAAGRRKGYYARPGAAAVDALVLRRGA